MLIQIRNPIYNKTRLPGRSGENETYICKSFGFRTKDIRGVTL